MSTTIFVESDCTFTFDGRSFESGGAIVTPNAIVAYPGANGQLKDWHGNVIGTWRAVSKWRIDSHYSSHMYQIEAIVNGIAYTGRGMGEGIIYRGKVKKGK